MHMCVCTRVCMCIYEIPYVCMCTPAHIHTVHTHVCIPAHAHAHTCTPIYTRVAYTWCTRAHIVYVYACVCKCVCACGYRWAVFQGDAGGDTASFRSLASCWAWEQQPPSPTPAHSSSWVGRLLSLDGPSLLALPLLCSAHFLPIMYPFTRF